ncbi:MAG TPA: HD domain-containing protein [Vitreimonas sp.]|nr:HD domain-containing protein [Vitreimonas sp.]
MQKEVVINTAKTKLLEKPFDIAHDIFHHYKVWENILIIMLQEGLNLDVDKLEIACWWHDYERGSTEHKILTSTMVGAGYPEDYIEAVKQLINTHSFHDQHSDDDEAKVLFDADKLEYVNMGRLMWMGEGILKGDLDTNQGRKYGHALNERIYQVVQLLHYPTTRLMMANNITNLLVALPTCQEKYKDFMRDVTADELLKAHQYLQSYSANSKL